MALFRTLHEILSAAEARSSSYSKVADCEEPVMSRGGDITSQFHLMKIGRWQWWILVGVNIFFLIAGQAAAVILGRFYYDQGGNSKWLATLIQTAAFPILFIPFFFLGPNKDSSTNPSAAPSIRTLALIYFFIGVLVAGDNMLYSVGLLYLSASTYSLICASQLAFNAIFSYFINSQKFTILILNSVIIVTLSASLIGVDDHSDGPSGVSKWKYFIGFICTIAASAFYSLILSLMQLSFEKFIKKETFSAVLEMQIYTALVATVVSTVGLFASGEWKTLHGEMNAFKKGSLAYVMTVVWTAVSWQVCSVGVVGLIFIVSSLFSNVISTVSLAITPIAAVIVFQDKMSGVKIIAMILAVWGFASYIYQNYMDDANARKGRTDMDENHIESA